jgi:hypothetical protein
MVRQTTETTIKDVAAISTKKIMLPLTIGIRVVHPLSGIAAFIFGESRCLALSPSAVNMSWLGTKAIPCPQFL